MIALEPQVLQRIQRHGESAYPEECCGVLLGRVDPDRRQVTEAVELLNGAEQARERRFRIGPEAYLQAERQAASRGLVLLGFYHSHPDHPARPSDYDLAHALPWHSYVILSVEMGRAREWSAWILARDRSRFEAEPASEAPRSGEV